MAYTTINKPSDYFNTVLYTGNNSTQSITGVNFQPDLVYVKGRNTATRYPTMFDSVRGATKRLTTNSTNAEDTHPTMLTSFDSDGWTTGADDQTNGSSETYVSWNWLAGGTGVSNTDGSITSTVSANTTSGFSIVTWTSTATSNESVGHGLGTTPKIVLMKTRNVTGDWYFYTTIIDGTNDYLVLNATNAKGNAGESVPTSSVFYQSQGSGNTNVAYCFAEKKGFSKFGTYAGNADNNGPFIYCGFSPSLIITKRTDTTGDWFIYDNKRPSYNVVNQTLNPNTSDVEESTRVIDLLSNGFKQRAGYNDTNASGGTYIYMAFAENPLVTSTKLPATAR